MCENEKNIRKLLRKLRKNLPPTLPVELVFVEEKDVEGCYGTTQPLYNKFIIRIAKGEFHLTYLVLLHEYAHVLAYDEKNPHNDEWGIAYGKCWRVHSGEL